MTARPFLARYAAACAGAVFVLGAIALVCLKREPKPLTAAELRSRTEALYSEALIRDIAIRLEPEAWSSLAQKPRRFVAATLEHAGETYHAKVRIKGHRSRRELDEKPAFKIEFADGGIEGAHALNLNNLVEDPTAQREVLAYRLMAAVGLSVPRVAYARVTLNGAPKGLYLMVEPLDDVFLAQRRTSSLPEREASGDLLYEGEYGCDVQEPDVAGFDRDAGKDGERSELRSLAALAAGDARTLFDASEGPLDMRAFSTYLAASAVVGDFDGYRHAHNYYLHYAAAERKWRFLPWGLDRAFTKRLALLDSQGLLARRCFGDPGCKLEYVRALSRVSATFDSLGLPEAARSLTARLDAETGGGHAGDKARREVDEAREALQAFLRERPAEVRAQLGCIDADGRELDRDGDGHGCTDCDDTNAATHPGAPELCDAVDNDCSGLVDDAAECPCKVATIAEREYQLCALPMPWADAARFCEQKGTTLVRIDDKQLSKKLHQKARRIDRQRWWIGYSDRETEGDFRWRDGQRGSFTYWKRSQPDNGSCNEDCAALHEDGKGKWHDTHCNQHRPFICGPAPALVKAEPAP